MVLDPGCRLLVLLLLVAHRSKQQRHARHRGEQDELLTERVEGADVEVQRCDDVGRVPHRRFGEVHHLTNDLVRVSERRKPGEADQQDGQQQATGNHGHRQPSGAGHSPFSSCWCSWYLFSSVRIFLSAAKTISGSPMLLMTSSDRATSGAWKVKNRNVRAMP